MAKTTPKKKVTTVTAKKGKDNSTVKEFKSKSGRNFQVKSSAGVDFWNPTDKGEIVEGAFMEMMKFKNTKFNDKNKTENIKAIILTDEGKQIALPNTHVIEKFFQEEGIKKGQYVHIEYGGKVVKKGQEKKAKPETFHSYICSAEILSK